MSAHVTESLSAYLDGEIGPAERARLEGHLRECPDCGLRLEQLAAVDAAARELAVEPPAGYFDSFAGRARQRIQGSRRRRTLPLWVLPLAAGLVVAVLAPAVMQRQRSMPAPETAGEPAAITPAPAARPESALRDTAARGASDVVGQKEQASPATPAPPVQEEQAAGRRSDEGDKSRKAMTEGYAKDVEARAGGARPAPRAARANAVDRFVTPPPQAAVEERLQTETKAADRVVILDGRAAATPPPAPPPAAAPAVAPSVSTNTSTGTIAGLAGATRSDAERGKAARVSASADPDASRHKTEAQPTLTPAATDARRRIIGDVTDFDELRQRVPMTVEEARKARELWRGYVRSHPNDVQLDEARVRTIEAGALAYQLGGQAEDRAVALRDARAYLDLKDAPQKARVQAVIDKLTR